MVAVRISRESVGAVAASGQVAGVTRQGAEVATDATQASTDAALVSRVAFEVVGPAPVRASVTRADTEVATDATQASTGDVLTSRLAIEVVVGVPREASVTRMGAEVATEATQASTSRTRVSRFSAEAVARRGSSGTVTPLAVPAGYEVFLHNWADEVRLNSSYLTNVKTSNGSGAESRRGLSLKPERTMRLTWQTDDAARLDRLYVMLRRLTDARFPVPLYPDQRELSQAYASSATTIFIDTSRGRWNVGARVVIVQFDACAQYLSHSFHLISDMEDDRLVFTTTLGVAVAEGSVVMPMMDCETLLEAEMDNATGLNTKVSLEVTEVPGKSALPAVKADFPTGAQTFGNAPIFDINPDWVNGIKRSRVRDGKSYTQGRGQRVYTAGNRSRQMHELFLSGDRNEMWRVVEFFDTRRGRLRSFWLTDYEFIWDTASIDASGNFVGVSEFGDFDDFKEELEDGWIGLVMEDGTEYVREVITVQQVLTVYRVTVSPALPAGLDASQVVRVARARRSRFLLDEMEETWLHTGYMTTKLSIIETLNEGNVTT